MINKRVREEALQTKQGKLLLRFSCNFWHRALNRRYSHDHVLILCFKKKYKMARRGKNKKDKNNDMSAFMGMMGMPGGTGMGDNDIDDADLEAELLALEGKKPAAKSKNTKVRAYYKYMKNKKP